MCGQRGWGRYAYGRSFLRAILAQNMASWYGVCYVLERCVKSQEEMGYDIICGKKGVITDQEKRRFRTSEQNVRNYFRQKRKEYPFHFPPFFWYYPNHSGSGLYPFQAFATSTLLLHTA